MNNNLSLKLGIIISLILFFIVSFTFGAVTQKIFFEEETLTEINYITGNVNLEQTNEETPKEVIYSREKPSPQNWIKESNIRVYKDQVIIKIDNPEWAKFTNTNSMDPVFDSESNAIEIVPTKPEQIQVGDIVSFDYEGSSIIHRVIKVDYDDKGWYMNTKGDNNPKPDPTKTRFEQVNRVVVAIIY